MPFKPNSECPKIKKKKNASRFSLSQETCSNCPPGINFPHLSSTFKSHQPPACSSCKLSSFFSNRKVKRSVLGFPLVHPLLCCFISCTSARLYICILHAMFGQIYSHFEMWLYRPDMLIVAAVHGLGRKRKKITVGTTPLLHKAGNWGCLFRRSTTNKIKLWLYSC